MVCRLRKLVVGIPALDEGDYIHNVVRGALLHTNQVMVVDDGSEDFTKQIAENAGATVLRHPKTKGYGGALQTIFRQALNIMNPNDILITMDGDGQHNPEDIPKVMYPVQELGADISIGSRFLKGAKTNLEKGRKFGIDAINLTLAKFAQVKVTDSQSGFRAYSHKAVLALSPTVLGMGVSVELLQQAAKTDLIISEVPITILYREGIDRSGISLIHGSSVLGSIIQFTVENGAKWFLLLSFAFFGVAALCTLYALNFFRLTQYLIPNYVVAAIGFTMMGQLFFFTSISLYLQLRLRELMGS